MRVHVYTRACVLLTCLRGHGGSLTFLLSSPLFSSDLRYYLSPSGSGKRRPLEDGNGQADHVASSNGPTIWDVPCDYVFTAMTTGILDCADSEKMVKSGVKGVFAARAGGVHAKALQNLKDAGIMFAPALACNAGGVVASGIEVTRLATAGMTQEEEFLGLIEDTIEDIYYEAVETAEEFNVPGDLHAGSVIAGFNRVAKAMQEQGHV